MDHFINALRHDRIDSLDEVTNVAARMALQDRFSKIIARKADGEESDGDAGLCLVRGHISAWNVGESS